MGYARFLAALGIGKRIAPLSLVAAALIAPSVAPRTVRADDVDTQARAERCAIRLSAALLGTSPSAALQAGDPQSQVDAMLASADFVERFSRFVNSAFNDDPGETAAADSAYFLAKEVLGTGKPWKDMFVGAYTLAPGARPVDPPTVTSDPNGLGFFRSAAWITRYAGNEPAGIRISAAYRMMNNVVGLKLFATTNAPGADVSAQGRQAPACRGCHFDGWSALDANAQVLGTIRRNGQVVTVDPYAGPAKDLFLGTKQIKDDRGLVTALVESEDFSFNACALAMQFAYGRRENACESGTFDRCVEAFKASGKIQQAVAALVKDPEYCE